jgi:hypothetical protein
MDYFVNLIIAFDNFLQNLWEGTTWMNWIQVMYAMFWFELWWWSSISHLYVLFVDMYNFVTLITNLDAIFGGFQSGYEQINPYA